MLWEIPALLPVISTLQSNVSCVNQRVWIAAASDAAVRRQCLGGHLRPQGSQKSLSLVKFSGRENVFGKLGHS